MREAVLYKRVRDLFEEQLTELQILERLSKEYAPEEIRAQIAEYHKDEQTIDDDLLIAEIEAGVRAGKPFDKIVEEQTAHGHPPFEIEKALMRAQTHEKDYASVWKDVGRDVLTNLAIILILTGTVLLTAFYRLEFVFLLVFFVIEIAMYSVSQARYDAPFFRTSGVRDPWKTDIDVSPAGLTVVQGTQGFYGSAGWGTRSSSMWYYKFWVVNQANVFAIAWILFGIMLYLGYYSVTDLYICGGFAAFSWSTLQLKFPALL